MGSGSPDGSGTMRNDRRTVFGWAMYDFANSAYTTTTLAVVLPALFASDIVPEGGVNILGRTFDAESLFSLLVAVTALIAFVGSPVLGAIGDYSASKRRFLQIFAYAGALLSLLFFFVRSGDVALTMVLFLIVETCWAIAAVFYDSFLPTSRLPTPSIGSRRGDSPSGISGRAQFALLALIQLAPSIGIDDGLAARLAMVMAGLGGWGSTSPSPVSGSPPDRNRRPPRRASWSTSGSASRAPGRPPAGSAASPTPPALPRRLLRIQRRRADGHRHFQRLRHRDLGSGRGPSGHRLPRCPSGRLRGGALLGRLAAWIGVKRAILLSLVIWTGLAVFGYRFPTATSAPSCCWPGR